MREISDPTVNPGARAPEFVFRVHVAGRRRLFCGAPVQAEAALVAKPATPRTHLQGGLTRRETYGGPGTVLGRGLGDLPTWAPFRNLGRTPDPRPEEGAAASPPSEP